MSTTSIFTYVNDNDINSFLAESSNYSEKVAFLGNSGEIAAKGKIYGSIPSHIKAITVSNISDWTNKQDAILDITTIRENAEAGANKVSNVQGDWNISDSSNNAYIKNKPTIPAEVTEATVSGWGFIKSGGTGGITEETDPVFTASAAHGIQSTDITNWNNKVSKTELSNQSYVSTTQLSNQSYVTSAQLSAQSYLKSFTETDPVFTQSAASGITSQNITNWNNKANLPSYSSSDAGKILSVNSSGQLVWITPQMIYSGSGIPSNSQGNDGDLYLQS